MNAIRTIDDHTELENIGSNIHSEIDDHIIANPDGTVIGQMAYWDGDKWEPIGTANLLWDTTDSKLIINLATFNGEINFNGQVNFAAGSDTVMCNKILEIAEQIRHYGDTNTYIRFTTDQIDFYAGAMWMLSLDEGAQDKVVFNPSKRNIDFLVHGDNKSSIIYVDASNDYIMFSGGFIYPPTFKFVGDYQVLHSDHLIYCDGTIIVTLPSSGLNGQEIIIVNRGTGVITVDGYHAETINGALTQVLANQYDSITVVADKGIGWYIIADTR